MCYINTHRRRCQAKVLQLQLQLYKLQVLFRGLYKVPPSLRYLHRYIQKLHCLYRFLHSISYSSRWYIQKHKHATRLIPNFQNLDTISLTLLVDDKGFKHILIHTCYMNTRRRRCQAKVLKLQLQLYKIQMPLSRLYRVPPSLRYPKNYSAPFTENNTPFSKALFREVVVLSTLRPLNPKPQTLSPCLCVAWYCAGL